ncbi:uncharacterized protein LOC142536825 isoform X1 [Primulina tabacum]|uniref:uncharacterized protein LOC142536825 isoform X1 n=1 Tax=Primulina tabacum TaxID=48773 RepID=UPI003F59D67D
MAQSATHSENGVNSGVLLSEEYENVPLKQRLKMLMAAHSISFNSVVKLESEIPELTPNTIGSVARKRGNKHSNSQMIETVMRQEKHAVKVEEGVDSQATKCSYSYSLPGIQQVNFGPETSDQFRDELDQVVLKERLRWLLARFLFFVHNSNPWNCSQRWRRILLEYQSRLLNLVTNKVLEE